MVAVSLLRTNNVFEQELQKWVALGGGTLAHVDLFHYLFTPSFLSKNPLYADFRAAGSLLGTILPTRAQIALALAIEEAEENLAQTVPDTIPQNPTQAVSLLSLLGQITNFSPSDRFLCLIANRDRELLSTYLNLSGDCFNPDLSFRTRAQVILEQVNYPNLDQFLTLALINNRRDAAYTLSQWLRYGERSQAGLVDLAEKCLYVI